MPERSINSRLRDECLNGLGSSAWPHAKVIIEAWRQEYNEERLKKSLGGCEEGCVSTGYGLVKEIFRLSKESTRPKDGLT
ncbi:MAG: integrase core domain-containing protein [Betaproteobacteria bacterium]|nr:integrase core domain-containing protein [Betaproteobacteria bacterium]